MKKFLLLSLTILLAISCGTKKKMVDSNATKTKTTQKITDPKLTEVWKPEPNEVLFTKSNVPSDAIVLFGGESADEWKHENGDPVQWIVKDNTMTVKPGAGQIETKKLFGDCQLHIEWRSPEEPTKKGQGKGNSGVFLQGKYEVQILNSYRNRTYSNGQATSIYKQHIPLVNATKPTGEWNVYDIIYHQPRIHRSTSGHFPWKRTTLPPRS